MSPGRLHACVLAAAVLMAAGCGTATGSASSADGLVPIGAGLTGLPALKAAVYAIGPPTVSALAFDSQGRLWLTTAAYTDQGDDGVYVVEKPGATPVKVVAALKTPLGLTWYRDTLYVTSTERVDAYSSFQGTLFAKHETILTLPAGVGQVNNIVQAPDGRLMAGISAPCDHCSPTSNWSGTIVSFRPDGSDLGIYATGIRAPFGLVYHPGTGDLFVTLNQRDDLEAQTPGDWLSLVRQGQDWGFPDCYGQGGPACAGVPEPIAALDKHAAAGGVAIVTGQLGSAAGTSAVVAEWALGKVQRVALTRSGSTYEGSVGPFLSGLKNPLPVLATADGAVLIGDWTTGKVYRIARS